MAGLVARLGLRDDEFERGIARAEQRAESGARRMGRSFEENADRAQKRWSGVGRGLSEALNIGAAAGGAGLALAGALIGGFADESTRARAELGRTQDAFRRFRADLGGDLVGSGVLAGLRSLVDTVGDLRNEIAGTLALGLGVNDAAGVAAADAARDTERRLDAEARDRAAARGFERRLARGTADEAGLARLDAEDAFESFRREVNDNGDLLPQTRSRLVEEAAAAYERQLEAADRLGAAEQRRLATLGRIEGLLRGVDGLVHRAELAALRGDDAEADRLRLEAERYRGLADELSRFGVENPDDADGGRSLARRRREELETARAESLDRRLTENRERREDEIERLRISRLRAVGRSREADEAAVLLDFAQRIRDVERDGLLTLEERVGLVARLRTEESGAIAALAGDPATGRVISGESRPGLVSQELGPARADSQRHTRAAEQSVEVLKQIEDNTRKSRAARYN